MWMLKGEISNMKKNEYPLVDTRPCSLENVGG